MEAASYAHLLVGFAIELKPGFNLASVGKALQHWGYRNIIRPDVLYPKFNPAGQAAGVADLALLFFIFATDHDTIVKQPGTHLLVD